MTAQTALDTYKETAAQINEISARIETLIKLRSAAMSNVSPALNNVLLENDMLRNIVWEYKHIDQNYIVFVAYKDHTRDTLLEFLNAKEGTYADYDLKRTADNDRVIITLSITPQREQLYIDRDYIARVIKEYRLVGIRTNIINARITSSNDLIDVLSSILIAVADARSPDQPKGSHREN